MFLDWFKRLINSGKAPPSERVPSVQAPERDENDNRTKDSGIIGERKQEKGQKGSAARASRRSSDMAAEKELAAFLDRNLYTPLLAEGGFISIKRIEDVELQLKGIDVEAATSSLIAKIDEKAQLYYINKNLPTFAFELQFLKFDRVLTGWFLNDNLETDYYLLIWPKAKTDIVSEIKSDDFIELDALMVSRKKLHEYLNRYGLRREILLEKADSLRRSGKTGKIPTGNNGIYYYVSDSRKYAEAPINLVIGKNHLQAIADAHYIITPDGFRRVVHE